MEAANHSKSPQIRLSGDLLQNYQSDEVDMLDQVDQEFQKLQDQHKQAEVSVRNLPLQPRPEPAGQSIHVSPLFKNPSCKPGELKVPKELDMVQDPNLLFGFLRQIKRATNADAYRICANFLVLSIQNENPRVKVREQDDYFIFGVPVPDSTEDLKRKHELQAVLTENILRKCQDLRKEVDEAQYLREQERERSSEELRQAEDTLASLREKMNKLIQNNAQSLEKIHSQLKASERDCFQKLKESSLNPLAHLKSSFANSSSDESWSDDEPKSSIKQSGRKLPPRGDDGGAWQERKTSQILKMIRQVQRYQEQIKDQVASNHENSSMLDLKTELCTLKSKVLQQDQKRIQEVTQKNLQISQLEKQLKQEQSRRAQDADSKQQVIKELERDIEVTLSAQVEENEKLKARVIEAQNLLKNYELFRKDVELLFLHHSVDVKHTLNATLKSIDFGSAELPNLAAEKDQKAVLDKILDVLTDSLKGTDQTAELAQQYEKKIETLLLGQEEETRSLRNNLSMQEQQIHSQRSQIEEHYKAQVAQQKQQYQAHLTHVQQQMEQAKRQNADLVGQFQSLSETLQKKEEAEKGLRGQLGQLQKGSQLQDKLVNLLLHSFQQLDRFAFQLQMQSTMGNLSSPWNTFGGDKEGDQDFSKQRILSSFVDFQEKYLNRLDKVLEHTYQSIQATSIGQDMAASHSQRPKLVQLFEEVLSKINSLNFVKQAPEGNVQFIIAQLGPILQRISDQLAPFYSSFQKRSKQSTSRGHTRSRSQDNEQLQSIMDDGLHWKTQSSELSYPKFCLGLIQLLKEYYSKLAVAPSPHYHGDPDIIVQVAALQDNLMLAEQMLKLKSYEAVDCLNMITKELEGHLKDLKGDYLAGVIKKIRYLGQPLLTCETSEFCTLTQDMSDNHLALVVHELLSTFGSLLKQLQETQKQHSKLNKKMKEVRNAQRQEGPPLPLQKLQRPPSNSSYNYPTMGAPPKSTRNKSSSQLSYHNQGSSQGMFCGGGVLTEEQDTAAQSELTQMERRFMDQYSHRSLRGRRPSDKY